MGLFKFYDIFNYLNFMKKNENLTVLIGHSFMDKSSGRFVVSVEKYIEYSAGVTINEGSLSVIYKNDNHNIAKMSNFLFPLIVYSFFVSFYIFFCFLKVIILYIFYFTQI